MMKRLLILLMLVMLVVFPACGGGGGGGGDNSATPEQNNAPTAEAGANQTVVVGASVTLDGTLSSDSDNNITGYTWVQVSGTQSVTIANANQAKAQFTAPSADCELTFKLTVTDAKGLTSSDTCVVTVKNETAIVEDMLYAAYAGIGYMKADDATDNARMYNAMFYELNQLTGLMVGKAVYFDSKVYPYTDLSKPANLLLNKVLKLGVAGTQTFVNDYNVDANDNEHVAVTLVVTSGGLKTTTKTILATDNDGQPIFNADGTPQTIEYTGYWVNLVCDLTVNFIQTSYAPTDFTGSAIGTTKYTGNQSADLTAHIDIDVILNNPVSVVGHEFSVTTSKTLEATSSVSPAYTIKYQPWNITYTFNEGDTLTNMHLLPVDYLMEALNPLLTSLGVSYIQTSDLPDYQLYSLTGAFTLNNTSYDFSDGMNYGQLEINQGLSLDGTYIALDGTINGFDVYSLGAEILEGNLATLVGKIMKGTASLTDAIKRDDNGLWQSGKLTLTGDTNHADVTFSVDETVSVASIVLNDSSSLPPISDWMNLLDPLQ